MMAIVLAALALVPTASAGKDPRVCSLNVATVCGKEAATTALKAAMSKRTGAGWDAQILCRQVGVQLWWKCTWKSASGSGAAGVRYKPKPSFAVTVTIRAGSTP